MTSDVLAELLLGMQMASIIEHGLSDLQCLLLLLVVLLLLLPLLP
jgi:hypothetical protein